MRPAFSDAQRHDLATKGYTEKHSEYEPDNPTILSNALLDDGDANSLLDGQWDSTVPMTLLQGRLDPDVPWHWAQRIAAAFPKADVTIHYIANGDHRLSTPDNLDLLANTVISACR
jgi:pimeloyl-ACP methyl ester carboxylesterase